MRRRIGIEAPGDEHHMQLPHYIVTTNIIIIIIIIIIRL
jgi:hypothetical protein